MRRFLAAAALAGLAVCSSDPAVEIPDFESDAGSARDAAAAAPGTDGGPRDGDAALPSGRDAARPAPDVGPEELPPPALFAVEPASGGCSVPTEVLLRGQGFREVLRVEVGGVEASAVEQLDAQTVRALFPPVELKARGRKLVSVTFADRSAAVLADGFEYLFDEDPVVFVHGFMLSPFGTMVDRFKEAGYPEEMLWRIDYSDPYGSNLANVGELRAFVAEVLNRTGAARVDLVVHSMGGLSSRLYLHAGGDAFVRDYVGIAGAFHGTDVAYLTWSDGAKEMRPPYACQGGSLNDVQFRLNGCLTSQGRTYFVDETPFGVEEGGPVSYLSISSEQDEFILPTHSSCLNQRWRGDCADAVNVRLNLLGHATILTDRGVYERTVAHLRARNRSRP